MENYVYKKGKKQMRKVKIITDSCSDLGAKLLEKYDIDYAKMSTVYNGEETPLNRGDKYFVSAKCDDVILKNTKVLICCPPKL